MRGRAFLAVLAAAFTAACSSDPSGSDLTDDGGAIPALDAGGNPNPVTPDGGGNDGGGNVDSGPKDTTAPLAVSDLAASTVSHTSIALTWTAPSDPPGGNVSSYEVRRSKANIANDAEFAAATPITVGAPKAAGAAEAVTATGLDPETTYYFAVRAKDAAGNAGPISNVASATTKARATVLLSEVAMANATGTDFIELVVTKAGNMKDVVVRQSQSPNVLHTFADFDVALGDRIVVHLTALPGPTGFAQEDATKSKASSTETAAFASNDAWDVYAAENGLVATDNLVSVVDGAVTLDAVAYSNRDGDASTASMTAFAAAKTATSWTFTANPVDATNDCATQREAVAVSPSIGDSNGACGRFTTGIGDGKSINRNGTTDTNAAKDWYVAAQTPGAANTAIPTPTIVETVATSLTSVEIRFSQEIDAATVAANVFTGSGVTISAATLTEPSIVTLTTSTQTGPHAIGIGAPLKTIYGASVPDSVRFCVYEPLGGMIALTEINPTIPASAGELIELQATRAGSLGGFSVRINATATSPNGTILLSPFPPGLCVALGDVLVLHVNPPADIVGQTETAAKNEHPVATFNAHYDGAWDLRGNTNTLPNSDSVVFVRDASNTYVDALAYTNANGNVTENTAFVAALEYAQSLGLWAPNMPADETVAASTSGVASTVTGDSLRRSSPTAARTAASWSVGPSSWGN